MKADNGDFECRQIVYFVQITTNFFCVTLQNAMRLSYCEHSVNVRNDYVVTQEI